MSMKRGLQQLNVFPSHTGADTCEWGGYVWEYAPRHPLQNQWGWVAQHRLVAETKLGRPLLLAPSPEDTEVVHHLNEVRHDNRPENLQVLPQREHRKIHGRLNADRQMARLQAGDVRTALVGRTIKEAAAVLGTTHMTLRRRFPDLVAGRKRRAPADVADPKWPALIAPLAADYKCTVKDAVRILGISAVPLRNICRRCGIVWIANKSEGRTGRPKKASPVR